MVRQEGGRWDVGTKSNAVYVERRSEENERIFEDLLEPEEARELAALLVKKADKADSTAEADSGEDDPRDDDAREKDKSNEDDSDDSDDEDDSDDKDDSKDERDSKDDSSS